MKTLPETYAVPSMRGNARLPEKIQVTVPGSKSITNRALLLAVLANGTSTLRGALFSDDSRHFLESVKDLGFSAEADEEAARITVTGLGGTVPKKEASIYVGSAGTAARFLTAYLGISEGTYHLDASAQMRKRPMAPQQPVFERSAHLLRPCAEGLYRGGNGLSRHGLRRHDQKDDGTVWRHL